jgi:hypothetical protein
LTRKQVCSEIQERVEDANFSSTVVCVENWIFFNAVRKQNLNPYNRKHPKLQDQRNFECRIQNLKPPMLIVFDAGGIIIAEYASTTKSDSKPTILLSSVSKITRRDSKKYTKLVE